MVLLVQKLGISLKHFSKLENHHHRRHHSSEAFSVSLQDFHFKISNCLAKLTPKPEPPGSEILSLTWFQQCLEVVAIANKAFAKLVVEIDYPMNKWEVSCIEEYLNYSLSLLDLLNSISSALSHLSQARLSMSHAASVVDNHPEKLKPFTGIKYKDLSKDKKMNRLGENKDENFTEKRLILHQALVVLKDIGSWVCSVVISGLCSDVEPYMEMRRSAESFVLSPMMAIDSIVWKEMMEKRAIVKEVEEANGEVGCLMSAIENRNLPAGSAKELQTRLEVLEKGLQGIEGEVSLIFSDVFKGRNELLNILRQHKQ